MSSATARSRVCVRVTGVVQGVGFRPFVYVTATRLGLAGSVRNDSAGVVAEVEGPAAAVDEFVAAMWTEAPPLASVERVTTEALPTAATVGFRIEESAQVDGARTLVGADVATCADCLAELADPGDRRHRHAFISCTQCGPRFTIITGLPYDRPQTTMAGFDMCPRCAAEYADPSDRRFHAQPIACHDCGPRLELSAPGSESVWDGAAVAVARQRLAAGQILAVKGIGGYHLACDATNDDVVRELRRRKQRGDKPFAVLVTDAAAARRLAHLDGAELALLAGQQHPIVLLAKRPGGPLSEAVAPGNPDLGVLLPYTPLHVLLMGLPGDPPGPEALVLTSGNLGGEPLCYDDDDALVRLAPLVDGWLRHDRAIHVPCDDSVTRLVDGVELPVRRSRGYAPVPVALPVDVPPTLAVGADLKNTCCVAEGRYAWLSQHVGDMDDLATLEAFGASERHLRELTGVVPGTVVADAHPGYRSSDWARRHSAGRSVVTVQHHHAHVAAVMAEHGLDGRQPVIGLAFDGTGYGTDGAIWGGEVLVADYKSFTRFAHLDYVAMPGGDATVHRPYRMALAHLSAAGVTWAPGLPPFDACPPHERAVLAHQVSTGFGCVPTSSMGRLFDAVSSIAGVRHTVDHEAQAAIELEGLARSAPADAGRYEFAVRHGARSDPSVVDARPVVRTAAGDVLAGVPAPVVAARFHAGVAELVRVLARSARERTGLDTVVLGGGCFANVLLLSAAERGLRADGFQALRPQHLPPNDGGIALGQVMVASAT